MKCYKDDIERLYQERNVDNNEFRQMVLEEVRSIHRDPCYIYENYYKIPDRITGKIALIKLMPRQRDRIYMIYSGDRYIELKRRQVLFTWTMAGVALQEALFKKNSTTLISSANDQLAMDFLQNKVNFLLSNLPQWIQQPIYRKNEHTLHFGTAEKNEKGVEVILGNNSVIWAVPRGMHSVISRQLTLWIADEFALVPDSYTIAEYGKAALERAHGRWIIGSTGRGIGNFFASQFLRAYKKNDGEFAGRAFFFSAADDIDFDPNVYEEKKRNSGSPELFRENYPLTVDDAFQTSSFCVFDVDKLMKRLEIIEDFSGRQTSKLLLDIGILTAERDKTDFDKAILNTIAWKSTVSHNLDYQAEIRIYEKPQKNTTYVVGVDSCEGVAQGDYSCFQVLNALTHKQAAVYHGRLNSDLAAEDCELLCHYYNDPIVNIEKNSVGLAFISRFKQLYSKIHHPEQYDEIIDKTNYQKFGTRTLGQSKWVFIGAGQEFIRDEVDNINDVSTIYELLNFVKEPDSVKVGADKEAKMEWADGLVEKMHDDRVMAFLLALQLINRYKPKEQQEPEELNDLQKLMIKVGRIDKNPAWCGFNTAPSEINKFKNIIK